MSEKRPRTPELRSETISRRTVSELSRRPNLRKLCIFQRWNHKSHLFFRWIYWSRHSSKKFSVCIRKVLDFICPYYK